MDRRAKEHLPQGEAPRMRTMFWTTGQLASYRMVEEELGCEVSVLAEAGDQYTFQGQKPKTIVIPEGKVLVQTPAIPKNTLTAQQKMIFRTFFGENPQAK